MPGANAAEENQQVVMMISVKLNSKLLLTVSRLLHWVAFIWFLFVELLIWYFRILNWGWFNQHDKAPAFEFLILIAGIAYFIGAWKCLRPASSTRLLILSGVLLSAVYSVTWMRALIRSGVGYDTIVALALVTSWAAVIVARLKEGNAEKGQG